MNIKKILNKLFKVQTITKAEIVSLSPNKRLCNKKILITGGGRGVGYAMAKKFVSEGAKVLITGRNEDTLKKTACELGCNYMVYDISDVNNLEIFVSKAFEIMGGVNVLVNNAGISLHEGNILNVTEDGYDAQFNTNLKGVYFLTQKFLRHYFQNKETKGSVLFLSSERGQFVDDIPYGLIKSSINSLTQGLAKLYIKNDIRINAVAPGITATDMTHRSADNLTAPNYATGRWYLPEEVAEIACFLISDAAGCLSGQILVCNNGRSVNSYRK